MTANRRKQFDLYRRSARYGWRQIMGQTPDHFFVFHDVPTWRLTLCGKIVSEGSLMPATGTKCCPTCFYVLANLDKLESAPILRKE